MLTEWTHVLIALIAAGLLKYAVDLCKWAYNRHKSNTSEGRQAVHVTTVDQSLAVVARARDELEADNALVRSMLQEERAASASREADLIRRHTNERSEWHAEKAALRAEIDNLQTRLREMLTEVEKLRLRTV